MLLLAVPASAGAAFPGGNGRIAFAKNELRCCAANVFSTQPDGQGLLQLTNSPGPAYAEPAYSPDGQRIAFESVDYANDRFWVYTMNPDGSGLDRVVWGGQPSFSPDGSRIVYIRGNLGVHRRNQVYVAAVDGSSASPRTPRFAWSNPVFSPDGSTIALERTGDIVTMDAGGGPRTNLTRRFHDSKPPFHALFTDPDYSPDGRWIVCSGSTTGETYDINLVRSDGSRLMALTNVPRRVQLTHPVFSPDGEEIAFKRDAGRGIARVMVMDRDGTNAHPIAAARINNQGRGGIAAGLSWQPVVP